MGGIIDDDDALVGGALFDRDAAGLSVAGRDDREPCGLEKRDVVGVVERLVDQLQQVSGG
jgi:hypothetical protein